MKIDQLIRSRRKTIALVVTPRGELVVRAPLRATKAQIQQAIDHHADWITAKQHEAREKHAELVPSSYTTGQLFWYLGDQIPLEISATAKMPLSLTKDSFVLAQNSLPNAGSVFSIWYQRQARQVIQARVKLLAAQHGYKVEKLRISSARTRWGSCSTRGTLSFTWRLVMTPPAVIDYVILHELAHLEHHNHSPAFWNRLQQLDPEYKQHKSWLKEHGQQLALPV